MRMALGAVVVVLAGCSRPVEPKWGLTDAAAELGISFRHEPGAEGKFLMPEIMGSGCGLFDMDGDGDLDALLLQGVPSAPHQLYRNDGGRFTNVTEGSGIRPVGRGMGVAVGDFDNDGRPDLLITAFGGSALYRNLGGGRFAESGQRIPGPWPTSAAFFDYDRDGWQDLAVLNYVDFTEAGNKQCLAATGSSITARPGRTGLCPRGCFTMIAACSAKWRALSPRRWGRGWVWR